MTSLPFPIFSKLKPVDAATNRVALAAVGRCRVHPESCTPDAQEFKAIVEKNREQAHVSLDDEATKDANKKLKKKYMKQGVAMASNFLNETLQLDVSIIDVEIVLKPQDVVATDGCLAACFLDAGCAAVVLDGNDLEAIDAAKVPRERVIARIEADGASQEQFTSLNALCSTINVTLKVLSVELVEKILALVPGKKDRLEFEMTVDPAVSVEDLADKVSQVSKLCKDGKGSLGIVDPDAKTLGMCFSACLKTDRPDGLFTTVVATRCGESLGLVYSSMESIVAALECGRGVYFSRSRNGLWRKGDTSGHYQTLHRIDVDCDADALCFTVTQMGDDVAAFCHLNTLTCWGEPRGIRHLEQTLKDRLVSAPEGSYTKRLFNDPELLRDKLVEEAQELSEATEPTDVAGELADVLYFAMVKAVKAGVSIDDAVAELDRRTRKVTRRQGDSKAFRIAAGKEILARKET